MDLITLAAAKNYTDNRVNDPNYSRDLSEVKNDVASLKTNKVDKKDGKGLSSNDFTDDDKTKLENLSNYDDTEIKTEISTVRTQLSDDIEKINIEVENKVDKVEGKDLFSGDYNDLTNTPDIPPIDSTLTQANEAAEAKAVGDKITEINNKVSEIKGYIGYTDTDVVGVEADMENNRFTRLAGAVGLSAGADFDKFNAFGGRKRCNLTDDGVVTAYYGDDAFTATGALEVEVTVDGTTYPIGTEVQVMVEQPRFYYKVVPLKLEKSGDGYLCRKARYYISDTYKDGFKLHPAFISDGVLVQKIYLSAFEATIYDTSAGAYLLEDEQVAAPETDKLSSIANAKPASNTTQQFSIKEVKKIAHNRGDGWGQTHIATLSATQMLFFVEYATFNSRAAIGVGNITGGVIKNTGLSLSLGNTSGTINDDENIQFVSYRGEENLWGNICSYVEGILVKNPTPFADGMSGEAYISDYNFTDEIDIESYEYIQSCGIPGGRGYISAFEFSQKFDWLFLPGEIGGNSSLPVGDMCHCVNEGVLEVVQGGRSGDTNKVGIFYLYIYGKLGKGRFFGFGARLIYIPKGA